MHMITCTPESVTFVCLLHSFTLRMNLWCHLLSLSWKKRFMNTGWRLCFLELNTTFHDRWLADHLVASTTLDADHWVLFDSGASAICCSKNFGEEWPLLPLNSDPPPLRSISGQPLHVYGRRFIRISLDGVPVCFYFYVCVMLLIRRFLLQGYFCRDTRWTWTPLTHVLWEHRMGKTPGLFVMVHFRPYALNLDHSSNMTLHLCAMIFRLSSTLRLLLVWWQPLTQCTIMLIDRFWRTINMLVRLHPRARKTLFVPNGTQGRPVPVEDLASRRVTEWNLRLEPSGLSPTIGERLLIHAQGLALSKVEPCSLILKPTGRCLSMKTSTLPEPQSLSESFNEYCMTLHLCAMIFRLSSTLRLLLVWWQLLTQCTIMLIDRFWRTINMLVRLHPRARKTLFVPNGTQGRPVPVEDLASRRVTEWNLRLEPSGLSPTMANVWWSMRKGWRFQRSNHVHSFWSPQDIVCRWKLPLCHNHSRSVSQRRQQRQRDGNMSTLLRDLQGHFRLKTRSLPSWTRQEKWLWRTLRLLSYKQFLTWAPRLLSGTFMTIGWTFLLRTSVCTTRSV